MKLKNTSFIRRVISLILIYFIVIIVVGVIRNSNFFPELLNNKGELIGLIVQAVLIGLISAFFIPTQKNG